MVFEKARTTTCLFIIPGHLYYNLKSFKIVQSYLFLFGFHSLIQLILWEFIKICLIKGISVFEKLVARQLINRFVDMVMVKYISDVSITDFILWLSKTLNGIILLLH